MFRLPNATCIKEWLLIPGICLWAFLAEPLRAENILLVSVDTLRADRLSCYGYKRNQTPHIDRWAKEGILFQRAYTESPLTLPAHSTILTGTYPLHHGVRENVGFILREKYLTLAEVLGEKGYDTAAFIGAYVLASEFGFSQGFDTFDEEFSTTIEHVSAATKVHRAAEEITRRFLAWLDRSRKPFFTFVHFFDPHVPRPNGYDWEVSRVDRCIGLIDAHLRATGLLDTTHIVFLSDHGESLGEHGEAGHGFFIYDSTLHVPLIFRPAGNPSLPVQTVTSTVSLVDVMPTILQMVDLSPPADNQGQSLLRLMLGKDEVERGFYAETFIPQLHFGWSPLRSYRKGGYKFIDAPRPELYDILKDPGEEVNLYSESRALGNEYKTLLEEFTGKYQALAESDAVVAVDLESRERLAALGYVGLSQRRASTSDSFGEGIDPKDRVRAFEACHKVINDLAAGAVSRNVFEEIASIRGEAPEMRGLAYLEARAHDQLGGIDLAEKKYRQALEENSENTNARYYLARILVGKQRLSEAEQQLLMVLKAAPDHYHSRNNLAGLYRSTGRIPAAVTQMEKVLDQRPGYVPGWQNLGQLYMDLTDWKKAEKAFRKVVELENDNAIAHFNLARVLRAVGRTAEADQEMDLAIRLDPRLARYDKR